MNGSNMDGTDEPKKLDIDRKPSFRKPSRRCIYIIVAVLILCIVICIVLAVELRPKSKNDCPKGIHCDWRSMPHSEFLKDERCDPLCTTQPCIRSAQYVLSRIDSSKDPCEDFYEFACGAYEEQAVLFPEQNKGVYTYQEMENEVLLNLKEIIDSIDENSDKTRLSLRLTKKLYNDCMKTDENEEVLTKQIWKRFFDENGILPWPLVNQNSRNDPKHLVKMMASTLLYDANPFFRIEDVQISKINKKDFLLFHFVKSDNIERLKFIHSNQDLMDVESVFSRYLLALGLILTEVGVDVSDMEGILQKIIEVQEHFLNLTTKAIEENEKVYENNRHLANEYHNHSCQDLDHNMGNMKWCDLVKELRKEYGLPPDKPIRIVLPSLRDYFSAVDALLGHYLDRDIINHIGVNFMYQFMKYMSSPLREIYYREEDLFPEKRSSLPLTSRWQQCVEVVAEFMSPPLEKEYLSEKLDKKARDQVGNMVNKIKEKYISLLDKMSWVRTALKGFDAKKLVRDMNLEIGKLHIALNGDEEAIDKYYSAGFTADEIKLQKNPLLMDVLQMLQFHKIAPIRFDEDDYFTRRSQFFVDNAVFSLDTIDLSYNKLVFPMFLPGRPMYAEYANLGSSISRYLTGVLVIHIDPENSTMMQAFVNTGNCLSEQSYLDKTGAVKEGMLDELSKLATLVIQTLGTHVSFQAYADYLNQNGDEKGLPGLPFSNEQLYFISAAQAECEKLPENENKDSNDRPIYPARSRVNLPLAHLKEFSEVFRCPADSSMNLKRRCCFLGDGKLSRDCK